MRSPKPLVMTRIEPGVAMPILADSMATDALERGAEVDPCADDEVTSQVSLPPGFDPSEILDENVELLGGSVKNARLEPTSASSNIDVFAKMMSKVIVDTICEINVLSASLVVDDTPENEMVGDAVNAPSLESLHAAKDMCPTTPRRSSRRKSTNPQDKSTPSRSSKSTAPVTPSRRSNRLASKTKE
jgi:hypothetical protein